MTGVQTCALPISDRSPARVFSSVCSFKPTAPVNVYVKFGTLVSESMTLSFDGAGIASSYDFGIISRPYSDSIRAPDDFVSSSNNLEIKNGNIFQGDGAGPYSESIEINADSLTVSNINSTVNGINTDNLEIYGDNHDIFNNTLISSSPYVFSRMIIAAQIKAGLTDSVIRNNIIIGGPQRGIDVSGNTNIVIKNNYISQNATVTNNHAMGAYVGTNLSFMNNTINATNGRGISCEHVNGCYIQNNYINVIEKPSMEYYHNFGFTCAHGIKLEGSTTNAFIYNNTVISRTGPLTQGGCPLNLGLDGGAGGSADIKDNSFTALFDTNSESSAWATALLIYGDQTDVLIKNNKFYSNQYFMYMDGVDLGPLIESNNFEVIGPNLKTFRSIHMYSYQLDSIGTRLLNNTFVGSSQDDIDIQNSWIYNWD